MKKCIKRFVSLGLLFGAFVFSFDKVNAMMRSDEIFEINPVIRQGRYSDEYDEALRLYDANPLTYGQIGCLDKWFSGHTCKALLKPAQEMRKNGFGDRLRTIENHQWYALLAWYSRNWDEVKRYKNPSGDGSVKGSDKIFEPDRRGGRCKNAKGMHTDEYYEAENLYKADPLTSSQIRSLNDWFGGHSVKYLLKPAQYMARGDLDVPVLLRIETRKELALLAWYSRNWAKVVEYASLKQRVSTNRNPAQTNSTVVAQSLPQKQSNNNDSWDDIFKIDENELPDFDMDFDWDS